MAGEQQQKDNTYDLIFIIGLIMIAGIMIWVADKKQITSIVFHIRYYELKALVLLLKLPHLNFFANKIQELELCGQLVRSHFNGGNVTFAEIMNLSVLVGSYTKYITIPMMIYLAIHVTHESSMDLRHVFNLNTLRESEVDNWPQVIPILKNNLIAQPLDDGPWAMSQSPLKYCKKHNLVDFVQENGKYTIKLRRGAAYRELSLQLGPKWNGVDALSPHLKALFAIFAVRVNGDKDTSAKFIDQLLRSSGGSKFNFDGFDELLKKNANSKGVLKIINSHAYVTTVMASMLLGSRIVGVMASADFLWLKPIDRRMWYMLNTVGRSDALPEICGAFAHWMAERKMGMPLHEPLIDTAISGLEIELSEVLYNPSADE